MKDIRGRDIGVGDHVVYIRSISDRNFEEGIIVVCKDDYVQIDYMGDGDGVNAPKTRRGRITATTKKIIVLNIGSSSSPALVEIFNNERKRFESEMKKIKLKMIKVLEAGEALATENELLQVEVNKIRGRWNILDFS
jgi:hypothetical protein